MTGYNVCMIIAKYVILKGRIKNIFPLHGLKKWLRLSHNIPFLYLEEIKYTLSDSYCKFSRILGPSTD